MPQKKIKTLEAIKYGFVFLSCIWAALSYSFVEEWRRDASMGRPLSTWNWNPAFTPYALKETCPPPALEPYAKDRQTYLELYQEYERSNFDFDLFRAQLQSAPFRAQGYQALFSRIKKPKRIFPRKVSILTPTHRPHDLQLILENFHRQQAVECELILLPNGQDYDLRITKEKIEEFIVKYPEHLGNIKIVDAPPKKTLGDILNIGIARATHDIVGRVDADDLYGPHYFLNMLREGFDLTEATLYGKLPKAFVFHNTTSLSFSRKLTEDYSMNYLSVSFGGATQTVVREILRAVPYRPITAGEDVRFCQDIRQKGGTIFSTSPFDACILRNPNEQETHTWKMPDSWVKEALYQSGNWAHIPALFKS